MFEEGGQLLGISETFRFVEIHILWRESRVDCILNEAKYATVAIPSQDASRNAYLWVLLHFLSNKNQEGEMILCRDDEESTTFSADTYRPENWKTPSPALKALIIKHLQTADPRKRKTLAWQNVLLFFFYLRFPYELLSAIISP